MPCQLARALGFLRRKRNSPQVPFKDALSKEEMTNEVSEYDGILLVRLGRGSAMQIRLESDRASVLTRTVPLGKATRLESDLNWQAASDSLVRRWIQSETTIWHWLVSKGADSDAISRRIAQSPLPIESHARRLSLFGSRSKASLSLT
jgi:hypothetical protein